MFIPMSGAPPLVAAIAHSPAALFLFYPPCSTCLNKEAAIPIGVQCNRQNQLNSISYWRGNHQNVIRMSTTTTTIVVVVPDDVTKAAASVS